MKELGFVIIGRNEGERLRRCLESVVDCGGIIAYVDSGSTDDSVKISKQLGAHVINLDMSKPFTAARARNTGFFYLMNLSPDIKFVQFIDGDCEIHPEWINHAMTFLKNDTSCGCVCGKLQERFPEKSIYNRICNLEWNRKIGMIDSCGGIFMIRSNLYQDLGGMNTSMIAGEEPEFCLRLRQAGQTIFRIDEIMGWHDAAMLHFRQWWKRTKRSGYAFSLGVKIQGKAHKHYWKQMKSAFIWGGIIPLFTLVSSILVSPFCLLIFSLYPILFTKIFFSERKERLRNDSLLYSANCVLGKFPQMLGIINYFFNYYITKKNKLIEYK